MEKNFKQIQIELESVSKTFFNRNKMDLIKKIENLRKKTFEIRDKFISYLGEKPKGFTKIDKLEIKLTQEMKFRVIKFERVLSLISDQILQNTKILEKDAENFALSKINEDLQAIQELFDNWHEFFSIREKIIKNVGELKGEIEEIEGRYDKLFQYLKTLEEDQGEKQQSTEIEDKLAMGILHFLFLSMEKIGNIISYADLFIRIKEKEEFANITPDIFEKSIKLLQKRGLIGKTQVLKSGIKLLEFLPVSLSSDQKTVIELAKESGFVTQEQLILKKWSLERIQLILNSLEENNIARRVEEMATGSKWYFPGFIRQGNTSDSK